MSYVYAPIARASLEAFRERLSMDRAEVAELFSLVASVDQLGASLETVSAGLQSFVKRRPLPYRGAPRSWRRHVRLADREFEQRVRQVETVQAEWAAAVDRLGVMLEELTRRADHLVAEQTAREGQGSATA